MKKSFITIYAGRGDHTAEDPMHMTVIQLMIVSWLYPRDRDLQQMAVVMEWMRRLR